MLKAQTLRILVPDSLTGHPIRQCSSSYGGIILQLIVLCPLTQRFECHISEWSRAIQGSEIWMAPAGCPLEIGYGSLGQHPLVDVLQQYDYTTFKLKNIVKKSRLDYLC